MWKRPWKFAWKLLWKHFTSTKASGGVSVEVTSVKAFTEASVEEYSVEASVKAFLELSVEVTSVEASTKTFGESSFHVSFKGSFLCFHGSFHVLPQKMQIVQVARLSAGPSCLVVKHPIYDKNMSIFWHERFLVFHLINCSSVIRYAIYMRSKYRCVPTPRPPRLRPGTIPFTITNIIVSLPRSWKESDGISLPRSVMRMCFIMMFNLHKQHNPLEPFPNPRTRSRPTRNGWLRRHKKTRICA